MGQDPKGIQDSKYFLQTFVYVQTVFPVFQIHSFLLLLGLACFHYFFITCMAANMFSFCLLISYETTPMCLLVSYPYMDQTIHFQLC